LASSEVLLSLEAALPDHLKTLWPCDKISRAPLKKDKLKLSGDWHWLDVHVALVELLAMNAKST
jgi:hypothetical protein